MHNAFLHRLGRTTAIALLFVVALNALAAGYGFMADPSGAALGISTHYLRPSAPFKNFLIPGIVLFVVLGLLSAAVAAMTLRRQRHYPMLIMLQGILYIGWIAIQLTMVRSFHSLHAVIALIGVVLAAIGWVLRGDTAPARPPAL